MIYNYYSYTSSHAEISIFSTNEEVMEYHIMVHSSNPESTYQEQLESILTAYQNLTKTVCNGAIPVFKRFFVSDAANQTDLIISLTAKDDAFCPVSIVEQPPLDGTKVALWIYLQTHIDVRRLSEHSLAVVHGEYTHYWGVEEINCAESSEQQTKALFKNYISHLAKENCSLSGNCIRTWFFVQNIDINYAGVVKGRNDLFKSQGLTPETHFIASTGINGRHSNPKVLVQLDTYAIKGLQKGQIQHLYAPTHMNPTYEYGVSFERGTCIKYGDRKHVFISGTASIDNLGKVVHKGDIRKQTIRMWENVEVLLNEVNCSFQDLAHVIVYLRDIADYTVVSKMFKEKFPTLPKVFVWAPVCRPEWLIEMECIAFKASNDISYINF